ncbi:MAG: hypothetical protein ABI119_03330 [Gemmatimonadaceae bacterium]
MAKKNPFAAFNAAKKKGAAGKAPKASPFGLFGAAKKKGAATAPATGQAKPNPFAKASGAGKAGGKNKASGTGTRVMPKGPSLPGVKPKGKQGPQAALFGGPTY